MLSGLRDHACQVVLSREERARILAGDHTALKREQEPDCQAGDRYTLIWSRARTVIVDRETGETASYPRRPLLSVEFGKPVRHRAGGWRVGLTVRDDRSSPRFLGPASSPASEDALTTESERGYRPTAVGAVDHLEALSDDELKPLQAKARERWAEHVKEMAGEEEARRTERALRDKLKRTIRQLEPPAAMTLLAAVEREIRRAQDE